MADSVATLGADLSELRRELAKLPNMTNDAAQKMLIALEKQVKKAEGVAKVSAKSVSKATTEANKAAQKSAEDAQRGFKGMIELSGISGDKIDKLKDVFAALSSPIGAATVGVAGIAIGIAAVTTAGIAAAAGMVAMTVKAAALAKELQPIADQEGFGIKAESLAILQHAADAFEALGAITKQVVVVLAEGFGPTVDRVLTVSVAMGLTLLDLARAMFGTGTAIQDYLVANLEAFLTVTAPVLGQIRTMISGLMLLAEATGMDTVADTARRAGEAFDGLAHTVATKAVGAVVGLAGDALGGLEGAMGDSMARAELLIGSMDRLGDSAEKAGKKVKSLFDLLLLDQQAMVETGIAGLELSFALDQIANAAPLLNRGLAGLTVDLSESAFAAEEVTTMLEKIASGASSLGGKLGSSLKNAGKALGSMIGGGLLSGVGFLLDLAKSIGSGEGSGSELANAAVDGALAFIDAVVEGLPDAISTLIQRIPELVAKLAEEVPGLLITVAKQLPVLLLKVVEQIPILIDALLDALPEIIDGLVAGLPDLISAIIQAVPQIIASVIMNLPAIVLALLKIVPAVIKGVADGLWSILPDGLTDFASKFWDAIIDAFQSAWSKIKAVLGDAFKEIVTFGKADTGTFGDTPGPVRAGASGLRANFAAGDLVVAARNLDGLRQQIGGMMAQGGGGGGGASTAALDIRDGHVAFERVFRRNFAAGGLLSKLSTGGTGQRRIF